MFIDRKTELGQLNKLYSSKQAVLFILYGRRRVGKTELLRAFCAEKPYIFFIATSVQIASSWLHSLNKFGATTIPKYQLVFPFLLGKPPFALWRTCLTGL